MRSDIIGILKNAEQRGQDLEMVVQSLVNAGYPKNDVQEARASIVGVLPLSVPAVRTPSQPLVVPLPPSSPSSSSQVPVIQARKQILQEQPRPLQPQQSPPVMQKIQALPILKPAPEKKGVSIKLLLLLILLLVLIGALVATIIFKDKLISFLS